MFKKKIKMEIPPQTRIEIIHKNFFNLLKEHKITQKKYSEDNNIPESTISKWKSYTSNMNEEHIYQAAKYFNISVNALYYTQQELKEISVLEVNKYDPIMAQQQIVIESLETKISNYLPFIICNIIVLLFFTLLVFENYKSFGDVLLLGLAIFPILSRVIYKITSVDKETYIINYLDQMYYRTDEEINKNFIVLLLSIILQSLLLTALWVCVYYFFDADSFISQCTIYCIFVTLVLNIVCIFQIRKKNKKDIYDVEIDDYLNSIMVFIMTLLLTSLISVHCLFNPERLWVLIIMTPILTLSLLNTILLLRKYSKYKLVLYDQKEDTIRQLFKN